MSKAKARNHKAALALIDREKIKLTEDGLEGFDEQIKSLKANEKTAFLFESDVNKEPEAPSGFKPDKKPQEPPEHKSAGASAAERYNIQMGVKGKTNNRATLFRVARLFFLLTYCDSPFKDKASNIFYFCSVLSNLPNTAAASARMALPSGVNVPSPFPLISPAPHAHCIAGIAYSLISPASV